MNKARKNIDLVERIKPFYEVFLHPKTLKIEGLREKQEKKKEDVFRGKPRKIRDKVRIKKLAFRG